MTINELWSLFKEIQSMIPLKYKIHDNVMLECFKPRIEVIQQKLQLIEEYNRNVDYYQHLLESSILKEVVYRTDRDNLYVLHVQLQTQRDEEISELTDNLLGFQSYLERLQKTIHS
jgi:hypothetical protein